MQQQIQINPADTLEYKCANCGNNTFTEALLLRKVPKFLVGSNVDQCMPLPVFQCAKCGEIHKESLAPQIKAILYPASEEAQVVTEEKPKAKIIQFS